LRATDQTASHAEKRHGEDVLRGTQRSDVADGHESD
jgi:hypothetical protein